MPLEEGLAWNITKVMYIYGENVSYRRSVSKGNRMPRNKGW